LAAELLATETTILAFDFGTRKIGVAVGNTLIRIAHPLETIEGASAQARIRAIAELIAQWRPATLVVGRPVHADGTPHAMTASAEKFARQLEGRFAIPVARADERYSTREATAALADAAGTRPGARKAARDAVAAQLILQSWFDDGPHGDNPDAAA
jgi:putative Holliday junction resolvase